MNRLESKIKNKMHLTLCLTENCTLRCAYCYAGPKRPVAMPRDTVLAALDFALEGERPREPQKYTVGFFGGEPLLEWDLLRWAYSQAVEKAKTKDVSPCFTITTNLTLLSQEKADWLIANNFHLGMSLDGTAAAHDTIRVYPDGTGSHADCVRAMRRIAGRGASGKIICVVHPRNVAWLAESVAWIASEFGFDIGLNPDFTASWDDTALATIAEQYARIGEFYVKRFRDGHPLRINVIDGKIITHLKGGFEDCDKCRMGDREIAVSVRGNLYPCSRLVGGDDNPDLLLGDVWKGVDPAAFMRLMARRGNANPSCAGCPVARRCMNWCGCVNYMDSGDVGTAGGFTCFHEKLAIETADRCADTLWAERNPAFLKRFSLVRHAGD